MTIDNSMTCKNNLIAWIKYLHSWFVSREKKEKKRRKTDAKVESVLDSGAKVPRDLAEGVHTKHKKKYILYTNHPIAQIFFDNDNGISLKKYRFHQNIR